MFISMITCNFWQSFGLALTISATIGRHQKMKDFPRPEGRLTKTSLSPKNFHIFLLLRKIVRLFKLLFRASDPNSVIATTFIFSIWYSSRAYM